MIPLNRHRLTASQRESLYDAEVEKAIADSRGLFPICRLCDLPISPGQRWHDNHDKYLPHAIGGERDGISHARCNLRHNHEHDTPLVAKVKRIRRKHIGAYEPRGRTIPGRRFNGDPIPSRWR